MGSKLTASFLTAAILIGGALASNQAPAAQPEESTGDMIGRLGFPEYRAGLLLREIVARPDFNWDKDGEAVLSNLVKGQQPGMVGFALRQYGQDLHPHLAHFLNEMLGEERDFAPLISSLSPILDDYLKTEKPETNNLLLTALHGQSADILALFKEKGVDIKDYPAHNAAMMAAVGHKNYALMDWLHQDGLGIDDEAVEAAAFKNDPALLDRMKSYGFDPATKAKIIVETAVLAGSENILHYMNGIDPALIRDNGCDGFVRAASAGRADIMAWFEDEGVPVTSCAAQALQKAVSGYSSGYDYVFDPETGEGSIGDYYSGVTPSSLSETQQGIAQVVSYLVAHHKDAVAPALDEALLKLAGKGHAEPFEKLLDAGAQVSAHVMEAAMAGKRPDVAAILIGRGYDLDAYVDKAIDNLQLWSPADADMAAFLIDHAFLNTEERRSAVYTKALKDQCMPVIHRMLDANLMDVSQGTWSDDYLWSLVEEGRGDILSLLLDHGLNVDTNKGLLLAAAIYEGDTAILNTVLGHHPDTRFMYQGAQGPIDIFQVIAEARRNGYGEAADLAGRYVLSEKAPGQAPSP